MPNRIFRSETGFHPLEAFGFCAAFSKPGMAFCCAYIWGDPSTAATMLADCMNLRRDTSFVEPASLVEATGPEYDSLLFVAFESVFIFQFRFCSSSQYSKTVHLPHSAVADEKQF